MVDGVAVAQGEDLIAVNIKLVEIVVRTFVVGVLAE
jgi:hypothetical protein